MLAYRYTVGLRSILLAIAGEGESERYLLMRERESMSIACELQDLEVLMNKAGVQLTGNAYDTAQDYLQDNCACATYQYLLGYKAAI
jgi:hypothetical protein